MQNELDIIEDILDEFDFDKVHEVMTHLHWTWHTDFPPPEVPTVGQLRKRARELMKSLLDQKEGGTSTGGFWASKKTFDGEPFYRLQFVVSTWDNYE